MAEGGGMSSGSSGAAYSGGGGGSIGGGSSGAAYSAPSFYGSSGGYGGSSYDPYGYQYEPLYNPYAGYSNNPAGVPTDYQSLLMDPAASSLAGVPTDYESALVSPTYTDPFSTEYYGGAVGEGRVTEPGSNIPSVAASLGEIMNENLKAQAEEADKARYNQWLKDQFIDPNSIGSARLYTDPVTGERKMAVPSLRQEEQAARALEKDQHYVNQLKRAEMEAARGAGSPKPSGERMRAEDELASALGPTYNAPVDEQRKYYLNTALASGGYKPIRRLGTQAQQPLFAYDPSSKSYVPVEQQQITQKQPYQYNPTTSARYGGPQKYSSNGYQ